VLYAKDVVRQLISNDGEYCTNLSETLRRTLTARPSDFQPILARTVSNNRLRVDPRREPARRFGLER